MSEGFTGERLSEVDGEFGVDLERHLAAYRFARARAAGRTVLDAGCGEGYGAALLAEVAARVVGADRTEAIALAAARHREPRLELRAIDLERLDDLDGRFDLVVSFQVIEHLPDPVGFLAALARGAARVLAWERARGEQVRRILRWDPLGLRRLLPAAVVQGAFPRFARLVRRRVRSGAGDAVIGPVDFTVGDDDLDRALDLMLVAPAPAA